MVKEEILLKKKIMLCLAGVTAIGLLVGCEEGTIVYKGKEMPESEAEERIADELEVENPESDLEIDIYEEADE
jgi:hypothetical protein